MTADLWDMLCLFQFVCYEHAAVILFSGLSGFFPNFKKQIPSVVQVLK